MSLPDWVQLPLQPWVSRWFPAYEYFSVQPLIAGPRLVSVRFAVKPDPQSLAE
jgi:hypothetical protein